MTKSKTNFYGCLKWIYRLLFWTGCLSLYNDNCRLQMTSRCRYYSSTMRLLLLVSYFGGFVMKLNNPKSAVAMLGRLTTVTKFILAFECLSCAITYVQTAIAMDMLQERHLELVRNMHSLDERVLVDFSYVKWNYGKTARKYTPLTFFVSVFYTIVSLVYVFIVANYERDWVISLLIAVSYAGLTLAPGLLGFLHVGYMDMVRIRFRLLKRLAMELMAHTPIVQRTSMIAIVGHYKSYVGLILQINSVFGFISVACVFYDFAVLTNMVFLLCQKATESVTTIKEFVFIVLLIIPRAYKVTMTAMYGYLADKERKSAFHTILLGIGQCDSASGIEKPKYSADDLTSFLHWQMLNRYELTIGKMIRCSLNVIFMVLNGIANYVIILIQLQLQQNSIRNQMQSNGENLNDKSNDVELLRKWQ